LTQRLVHIDLLTAVVLIEPVHLDYR
jgi:hypothetical protein